MRYFDRHKKQCMSYAKTAGIAFLFLAVAIPFGKRLASTDTSTIQSPFIEGDRYRVVLNGEELGYVEDESLIDSALLTARSQIKSDNDGLALVETDLAIYAEKGNQTVLSQDELSTAIYDNLSTDVVVKDSQEKAYTVRIDDFTVTLASKDEVAELLERVKDKYTGSDEFQVELVEDDTKAYTSYKTNFVTADVKINEAVKVLASSSSKKDTDKKDEKVTYTEGVISVDFSEKVEVIPTKAVSSNIVSVDEAYELITKEHQEKGTYIVKSGDTLSGIAEKNNLTLSELYALNYGVDDNTTIYVGDVFTITVPASEISVVVVEEAMYDEEYNAEIEYVDNPGLYVGTENIINEGSAGKRSVVALVTSVNGTESKREIIKEDVKVKPVPRKIERGTLEPPTYIKPVNSTMITSEFGYRYHPVLHYNTLHSGTDWYVPSGTPVKAAATGTVIAAGWNGNYGNCVDIRHSDGSMTRYAHLSSIAVAYGQQVRQGEVVAYSGATGVVTGPHLHFEIYIGGVPVNAVNYVGR